MPKKVCTQVMEEVKKVIVGKDQVLELVLAAIFAGGNILIEDIPGVGKTTLANSFQRVLGLEFRRMQFTPEVIPSDILGFSMYHQETGSFSFEEGAIMCNMFLADELNRASAKTQSALLEAMEEKQITVEKQTIPLPDPFLVIATQNPVGSLGTQEIPYSQLDRFMVSITMGYPDRKSQLEILKVRQEENPLTKVCTIMTKEQVLQCQAKVKQVETKDSVLAYMISLAEATRTHGMIEIGVSPRGIFALHQMAKAYAFIKGRDYVTPSDVSEMFIPVCKHRMVCKSVAEGEGEATEEILKEILRSTPAS